VRYRAAVACPDRKVVCLQADGGGMYSLQALWTQARENLDVVNVVFANRVYLILTPSCTGQGRAWPRFKQPLQFRPSWPRLGGISQEHGRGGDKRGDTGGFCRCVSGLPVAAAGRS